MKRVVVALGLHRDANLFGDQNRGILAGMRSLFSGGQKRPSRKIRCRSSAKPRSTQTKGQIQLKPEENARAEPYAAMLCGGLGRTDEGTNIVNITLKSSNPGLAAKVSDKVAELFIKEDAERETAGAQKAYEDLRTSIEELKATIAQQENDLSK